MTKCINQTMPNTKYTLSEFEIWMFVLGKNVLLFMNTFVCVIISGITKDIAFQICCANLLWQHEFYACVLYLFD